MTTTLIAALAEVCGYHGGYHEGDDCSRCADLLVHLRGRGWSDAEILADIELYRSDFGAWMVKVQQWAATR